MFMRPNPHAAPRNYRDIADAFDRMGNFVPGMSPGFANPLYGAAALQGLVPAAGPSFGALGFPSVNPMGLDPAAAYAAYLQAGCTLPCCPPPMETVGRVTLVGFPRVCIPGCDCETIETSVCGPFTLTNLFIPAKIASCLSITRFRIGCWDLLVNCDPVPAELFSCCELDENMFGARPVDANSPICLTVENECKDNIPFEGAIKGVLCEPC